MPDDDHMSPATGAYEVNTGDPSDDDRRIANRRVRIGCDRRRSSDLSCGSLHSPPGRFGGKSETSGSGVESLSDLGGSAASLHPARDILQLASKMFPRQGEVQGSGPDAVALDDDVEVGLPVRGGSGIEQHSAG